jgi:hypothetical protein
MAVVELAQKVWLVWHVEAAEQSQERRPDHAADHAFAWLWDLLKLGGYQLPELVAVRRTQPRRRVGDLKKLDFRDLIRRRFWWWWNATNVDDGCAAHGLAPRCLELSITQLAPVVPSRIGGRLFLHVDQQIEDVRYTTLVTQSAL